MKDRIKQIMEREGVTASKFADNLGVQRSSISHLVSGRNKPSLDFIQKVLEHYKDLNPEWFLLGIGKMYKSSNKQELFVEASTPKVAEVVENKEIIKPITSVAPPPSLLPPTTKTIEQMVIFYTDNTFDIYTPNKK